MCYSIFIEALLRPNWRLGRGRLSIALLKIMPAAGREAAVDRSPVFGKVSLSKRGHLLLSVNFSFFRFYFFFLAIIVGKVQYREAFAALHSADWYSLATESILMARYIRHTHTARLHAASHTRRSGAILFRIRIFVASERRSSIPTAVILKRLSRSKWRHHNQIIWMHLDFATVSNAITREREKKKRTKTAGH